MLPTLLDDTCWVPLSTLLHVVASAQSLKPVKLLSLQLPTFLLFRDRRSVAQQFWIRLRSSPNIVEATHSHYTLSPKSYGLYPSHDALQVPTLLGVVASICTPLPTRTQQLPTYPPISRSASRIPLSVLCLTTFCLCKISFPITFFRNGSKWLFWQWKWCTIMIQHASKLSYRNISLFLC